MADGKGGFSGTRDKEKADGKGGKGNSKGKGEEKGKGKGEDAPFSEASFRGCKRCGKDNRTKTQCWHNHKTCDVCGGIGREICRMDDGSHGSLSPCIEKKRSADRPPPLHCNKNHPPTAAPKEETTLLWKISNEQK